MAEVDEITDDEKLQIAQHFLLSSPPGQFTEILTDVRKLLPEGLLSDPLAAGMARAYNNKTSRVVSAPSGDKTILCPQAEVDPTHYVDAQTGSVFTVDHLSLLTKNDESTAAPDQHVNLQSHRTALQSALSKYVLNRFATEEAAAAVLCASETMMNVIVAGERINLRNYWSGKWTSKWQLQFNNSLQQVTVSGDIKIHGHYFEDGNVQLVTTKTIPAAEITFDSAETFAEKTAEFIQISEHNVQVGLENMYANMNEETFRAMRRIMPVTRTKMDWNINAVRMNKQVRK